MFSRITTDFRLGCAKVTSKGKIVGGRSKPGKRCRARAVALDENGKTKSQLKLDLMKVAAMTDRGQQLWKEPVYGLDAYNRDKEKEAKQIIEELCKIIDLGQLDESNGINNGTWELIFATKQLFRASPFFMAISEAFEGSTWHAPWSDPSTAVSSGPLFFRLHELQVMSWGTSTVGRVTQTVDLQTSTISSTFDTIIFRLTVIPIIGWFKLLPTFGGTVSSFAKGLKIEKDYTDSKCKMKYTFELDKTRVDSVEGIPKPPFFLAWLLGIDFPVNSVWNLLPWNKEAPTCTMYLDYVDEDLRICSDSEGEVFVYIRQAD